MKVCSNCATEISTPDGVNKCTRCSTGQRNKEAKRRRREMDSVMDALGLVKVRGARGGVYYE